MSQVNQTPGSGETVTFQLTTTMPCQLTTILDPSSTRTICFHKLLEAMKDQGWKQIKRVQEGDTVTATYIPSADEGVLADLLKDLPRITPPTDGGFAVAKFYFGPSYPYVATIKAPAHWWPQEAAL